jgi:hypothetical protein
MEVSGQFHAPAALPPGKEPWYHWIRDWVGPRAVLDAVVKRRIPSPRRESNPRTPIRNTGREFDAGVLWSGVPIRLEIVIDKVIIEQVWSCKYLYYHTSTIDDIEISKVRLKLSLCLNSGAVGSWTGGGAPLLCRGRRGLLYQVVVVGGNVAVAWSSYI